MPLTEDSALIKIAFNDAEKRNYGAAIGLLVSLVHRNYPWAAEKIGEAIKKYAAGGRTEYETSIRGLEPVIGSIKKSLRSANISPKEVGVFHALGELREQWFNKQVKEYESVDTLIENLRAGVANYHFSQIMGYEKQKSLQRKHKAAKKVEILENVKWLDSELKAKNPKEYLEKMESVTYETDCDSCAYYIFNKILNASKGTESEKTYFKRIQMMILARGLLTNYENKELEISTKSIKLPISQIIRTLTEYLCSLHEHTSVCDLNSTANDIKDIWILSSANPNIMSYAKSASEKVLGIAERDGHALSDANKSLLETFRDYSEGNKLKP